MVGGTFMNSHNICLVLEDDCDIRDQLSPIFSHAGFKGLAQPGTAGLQAARAVDPVLITLDVGLRNLNECKIAHNTVVDECLR